jgi:hypothetical protein
VSDETIDRTKLPIRRPPFSGVAEQTLGGSQPGSAGIVAIYDRAKTDTVNQALPSAVRNRWLRSTAVAPRS